MTKKPLNIFQNNFAKAWIDKKISCCEIKPKVALNFHSARAIVHLRLRVQEGRTYPVFCDMRQLTEADEAARIFISKFGFTDTKAVSFLVTPGQMSNMRAYLKAYNISTTTNFISVNEKEAFKKLAPYK